MGGRRWVRRGVIVALVIGVCMVALVAGGRVARGVALRRYPVRGVDVSKYQGDIDWAVLSRSIDFAYIKATEGSGTVDPCFARNWADAAEVGVLRGAYHFFSFDSVADAQAANLIGALDAAGAGGAAGMLPVAIDVELYGAHKRNPPEAQEVRAALAKLLDEVEARYGRKPVLYATVESYRRYVRGAFDAYPLWIRDVYAVPDVWGAREWAIWQHSDKGTLAGYIGEERYIDLNVYAGTRGELEGMAGSMPNAQR